MGISLAGYNAWPEDFEVSSPEALVNAYEQKRLAGSLVDREATEAYEATQPWTCDAMVHSFGLADFGKGKLSTPFRSYMKLEKNAFSEAQVTGDCVSHYVRNCLDTNRAVEIDLLKQPEEWVAMGSSVPIYGDRGHGGQGANCATLANFVVNESGLMFKQNYPQLGIDLTNYNSAVRLGIGWGRSGVPSAVVAEGKKYPATRIIRVKSLEEARDLMAAGYASGGCSGYSFSSTRDDWGVSQRTAKGWSHAMAWTGFDDRPVVWQRYNDCLVHVSQSWGKWNGGGWNVADYGPAPIGGFWILGRHARGMIESGWIAAVVDFAGPKKRDLPSYGAEAWA